MSYLIVNGDCRRGLVDLARVDAVVTDPPYGMGWDADSRRFSGGQSGKINRDPRGEGRDWPAVIGDDEPFDPVPWLKVPKVIFWGANHFASRLPVGTTLVWVKRYDHLFGSFLSDAEIGWQKGNHGVYCYREATGNTGRAKEGLGRHPAHQTQKPIRLMRWCIRRLRLPTDSLILDPYMGSGTTLIAALAEGHRAIGIELDPRYCAIARRRLERPHAHVPRPSRDESFPLFP